ncbi:MAG: RHS repeat-associated core domain-containing protein, partial [Bacteroidota bacterium]
ALYYSNINDNTGTLIFSYATSCDFAFNYLRYQPNSLPQPIDPYSLIIPIQKEKEFGYDFAVSNSAATLVNNSLHPNLQTILNTAPQTNLLARISYDISYDKTGNPIQYHLYSYNNDGLLAYEMMQFSETGITTANRGICGLIRNINFNLRGSIKNQIVDAGADGTPELSYAYEYDGRNRVKELSLNGVKLLDYKYDDALSLVLQIRYYDKAATCNTVIAIDTLQYYYDDRDRLVNFKSHLYEESLYYDANHPQLADTSYSVKADQNWNGLLNATKSVYKTDRAINNLTGFDGATIYGYRYDGINRLIQADASIIDVLTGNPAISTPKRLYGDESLTYDKAGNILNLKRGAYYNPSVSNPANWVTNWDYIYQTGTSKLIRIDSNSIGLRNFTYDANGCVRNDSYQNLSISHIDRANLISEVTTNGEILKNLYSVIDQRILKENLNTGEKTFYWQSVSGSIVGVLTQQNNNWLQGSWEFYTGAAKLSGGELHYQIVDHIGNKRVVYSTSISCTTGAVSYSLENVIDYYAFGKTLREYVNQKERYQYSGKERDEETLLDYFGARFYDSNIGRFLSVDPLEAKYINQSTYVFAANNPVCFVDLNGEGIDTTKNADNNSNTSGLGFSSELKPNQGNIVEQKFDLGNSDSQFSNTSNFGFTGAWGITPKPLYKKDLISISQKSGFCNPCNANELGKIFEDITYTVLINPLGFFHNMKFNTTKISNSTRPTVPDFIGDQKVYRSNGAPYYIKGSSWVEAKAKYGDLYMSSNTQQIRGHIDNLSAEFLPVRTGLKNFRPHLYIITTADTYVSESMYIYATAKGIQLIHYHMYYAQDNIGRTIYNIKRVKSN